MFDGLESARSRVEGHFDEVTIKFEKMITPRKVILDFKYFVNNNPKAVEILLKTSGGWITVAGPNYVKPFAANQKEIILQKSVKTDHISIRTLPDGGINRVHVYE
jgi:allantoicase